jgi:hypothetical protein
MPRAAVGPPSVGIYGSGAPVRRNPLLDRSLEGCWPRHRQKTSAQCLGTISIARSRVAGANVGLGPDTSSVIDMIARQHPEADVELIADAYAAYTREHDPSGGMSAVLVRCPQAAALADALQADYFRGYLQRQRSLLARELAKHVDDVDQCDDDGCDAQRKPNPQIDPPTQRMTFGLSTGGLRRWIGDSPSNPSRAEFGQLLAGVALHQQRDEVADWSSVESGVFVMHDPSDVSPFDLFVCICQSVGQLVDDLLFTQLDHQIRLHWVRRGRKSAGARLLSTPPVRLTGRSPRWTLVVDSRP